MGDSDIQPLGTMPPLPVRPPKRTPLIHLEPIAVGSGMAESLTSYMARIAQAHCLSVKNLISPRLMAGFARRYHASPHGTRSSSWSRGSRAINGTGLWARDAVGSLETLVGRSDLRFLTMLPWAGVIPTRGLLKKSKAWCPLCYRDRLGEGRPLYDPLVWLLSPIKMCVNHQRPLESACPQCRNEVPCLSSQAVIGRCPACGGSLWVVSKGDSDVPPLDPRERCWQTWMIGQLGDMFSRCRQDAFRPDAAHLYANYARCTKALFGGSVSEAARLIQVSPKTLREWIAGTQLPSLEYFLRSCFCFGVSPVDVLTGPAQAPSLAKVRMPLWLSGRPPTRPPRIFDKHALLAALEEVAEANYLFPPSMADVSRALDVHPSHLMRLFPGVCAQISRRYLAFVQRSRQEGIRRATSEAREITQTLLKRGVYPGYDLVSSQMSRPWAMRLNEVRSAWHVTLHGMGASGATREAIAIDGASPDGHGNSS